MSAGTDRKLDKRFKMFVNGEPAVDIARRNGISKATFDNRVFNGWSIENACTVPTHRKPEGIREVVKTNFVNTLLNNIKKEIQKCNSDYEQILILNVVERCIQLRWSSDERAYHLTHNKFTRIKNYIEKKYIELDIPEETIETIVNANIDIINSRVEKWYDQYFSEYEKRKMVKWQNR
jgi:hypothetical protein